MKKERKDKDFIKSAYYEGGKSALEAFVRKELRYPKEALKAKAEGTVSVRYTVDYKGHVIQAEIISGLGHGCDEEALRIVRSLQFRVPEDGKIKSKYSRKLHIHFRLPGSPGNPAATKKGNVIQESLQVNYQITSSSPANHTSAPPKSTSYQIQITFPGKKQD